MIFCLRSKRTIRTAHASGDMSHTQDCTCKGSCSILQTVHSHAAHDAGEFCTASLPLIFNLPPMKVTTSLVVENFAPFFSNAPHDFYHFLLKSSMHQGNAVGQTFAIFESGLETCHLQPSSSFCIDWCVQNVGHQFQGK